MPTSTINRDAQLSTLANAAYLNTPLPTISTTAGTWKMVGDPFISSSGFYGVAYHNAATGQVVLSYRGTDGLGDLKADTNFVTGGWSQQFTDAAQFTSSVRNTVKENPEQYPNSTLLATGHSLGDGIAQIMGQMFDLIGAGFEGPGAARIVANPQFAAIKAQYAPDTNGQIGAYTTYRASGSVISDTGTHLGNTHDMVNLAEGDVLGFTGAVIGIVGFASGGAGGVLLSALGVVGINVDSTHRMDGMERAMYIQAGLENALASGELSMSNVPWSSATGQVWSGEGHEPQVTAFKNTDAQVAAYVQKEGNSWKLATPDQQTSITLTPASAPGNAPQCVVTQVGKQPYSCVIDDSGGIVTRPLDANFDAMPDQPNDWLLGTPTHTNMDTGTGLRLDGSGYGVQLPADWLGAQLGSAAQGAQAVMAANGGPLSGTQLLSTLVGMGLPGIDTPAAPTPAPGPATDVAKPSATHAAPPLLWSVTNDPALLNTQVDALISAMAAFAPPAPGQTTLPTNYQTTLNPMLAANPQ